MKSIFKIFAIVGLAFAIAMPVVASASQSEYKKGERMQQFRNNVNNYKAKQQQTQKKSSSSNRSYNSYNSYSTPTYSAPARNIQEAPDNTNRKIFLKNQIIDLNNKIKQQEKEYEKQVASGSEDDWRKKQAVESKRNYIDELVRQKSEYEAELSRLK